MTVVVVLNRRYIKTMNGAITWVKQREGPNYIDSSIIILTMAIILVIVVLVYVIGCCE